MKYKAIYSLIAALVVAVPAVAFARGSDDLPFKMMEQMFKGTPFGDAIDSVPRNDRDRSKGDRDNSRDRDHSGGRDRSESRGGDDGYSRKGGRDHDYSGDGGDWGGKSGGRKQNSRTPEIPVSGSGGDWFSRAGGGEKKGGYDDGGRKRDRADDAGGGRKRDRADDDTGGRRGRQQD